MIIKENGKYRLTEDFILRSSLSVSVLGKGSVIEITQIDEENHKVIGPGLEDWFHWDVPCEKVDPEELKKIKIDWPETNVHQSTTCQFKVGI